MHVVLSEEEQNRPEAYPEWCNLSWFYNCRGITGDAEPHYHDAAEIWLWHEGAADGVVEGKEVSDGIQVIITNSGDVPCQYFDLDAPYRIVLDMKPAVFHWRRNRMEVDHGPIRRIRMNCSGCAGISRRC